MSCIISRKVIVVCFRVSLKAVNSLRASSTLKKPWYLRSVDIFKNKRIPRFPNLPNERYFLYFTFEWKQLNIHSFCYVCPIHSRAWVLASTPVRFLCKKCNDKINGKFSLHPRSKAEIYLGPQIRIWKNCPKKVFYFQYTTMKSILFWEVFFSSITL